jgi:outer membrane protein assembly factor BamB
MVQDDGELLILSPYGRALKGKLGEAPAAVLPLTTTAARLLAPDATKAAEALVKAAAAEAAKRAVEAKTAAERTIAAVGRTHETAIAAAREAEEAARAAEEAATKLPPVFNGNEQTVLVFYKNGRAESIRWYNEGKSTFSAGFDSSGFPSPGFVPLAAINRNDTIGAVMTNGTALLFSMAHGQIIWSAGSHITATDTAASLIYDERGFYALTRTGATAYTESGKQRWTIRFPGTASPPAFDDEGILYSGSSEWVLNAYHMEDTVKSRKQSRYGPAAPGSYTGGDPRPSPWAEGITLYDPEQIGARLGRISTAIRKGQVGENEQHYTAYLMEIAGSIEAAPLPRTGGSSPIAHPLVHVNYRAEAARLLSYIGSRETIPFLANLCHSDPESVVKAAAAEAIGAIGVDPDGKALTAFAALVFPQISGRDDRVMASIAAATGALCRFSGPPLSKDGTRVLTAIANLGPNFARGVARRELQTLMRN